MSLIVTDVERPRSHSTPRSARSSRVLRRVILPVMAIVTVLPGTVLLVTRPAAGDSISSAKAQAAAIASELAAAQNRMSALSQQYDAAAYQLSQINASIASTKATITADQKQVSTDRSRLSKAAIANYVSDGAVSSDNPIFSGNEKTVGAATEYNQIAQGDINLTMANLHTAENTLNAQQAQLQQQQGQATQAVQTEQAAVNQNAQEIQDQKNALAQENGKIATLVAQQQQQQAQAAAQLAQSRLAAAQTQVTVAPGLNNFAPPPTAAGGAGAVQAAESQLGGKSGIRLLGTHRLFLGPSWRRPPPLLGRSNERLDSRAPERPATGRSPLLWPRGLRARGHVRESGHDD